MAKTQDLKRRIRSVKNTMQLTRAMKMVAAAKLRRAQDRMMNARPYAHRMLKVLRSLATRANPELHPMLQTHGDDKVDVLIVTADKGLCGAFNAGILREAENLIADLGGKQVSIATVGRKGREHFVRRTPPVREWTDVFRMVSYDDAKQIADWLIDRYTARESDRVMIVFNEFKSAIQAKPIARQLLPIEPVELEAEQTSDDYIYEPSAAELFSSMLPNYVRNQVFQAMLESAAAEHAARMTAMDAATTNAGELIESLTLTMNRVRQASITTEIIEIVSGAEALGG